MLDSFPKLQAIDFPPLEREPLQTLQVNLGYRCNLQCQHCHVNAGPHRTEQMQEQTLRQIYRFIQKQNIRQLDLTGGAPEMHPKFADILHQLHQLGCKVIVRSNLVILLEPGYEHLTELFRQYPLTIMASMPCYLQENVDRQRGKGTFDKSIQALQLLNQIGYGLDDANRQLNLIFNPQGPDLPASQQLLEQDYKRHLLRHYRISFNQLLTITNQPIKRFGSLLLSRGQFDDYMQLLQQSFAAKNLQQLMCKTLISIDYQGYIYDCDFNQMLNLPARINDRRLHIRDYDRWQQQHRQIQVAGHCYACTAGSGSSCGGALS